MKYFLFSFFLVFQFCSRHKAKSTLRSNYVIENTLAFDVVIKPWKLEFMDSLTIPGQSTYTFRAGGNRATSNSPLFSVVDRECISIIFNDTVQTKFCNKSTKLRNNIIADSSWQGGEVVNGVYYYQYTISEEDFLYAKDSI